VGRGEQSLNYVDVTADFGIKGDGDLPVYIYGPLKCRSK